MSTEDVVWLEGATGRSLRSVDPDDLPLAKLSMNNTPNRSSSSKATSAEKSKRPSGPPRKQTDWFDFFLTAGCDLDDCTRYATNFERDRIDETLLTALEAATMRNLGLREGDVIRVRKHIKQKYGSAVAGPSDPLAEQIRKDEELARQLSGQDATSGHNIFTNGPNGSLKTTRRGRPPPNRSGSSTVDLNALTTARDLLQETTSSSSTPSQTLLEPVAQLASSGSTLLNGGFDDDAWTVRPTSTTPQPPVAQSTPAPQPTVAAPATIPAPLIEPVTSQASAPQPSLEEQIFQKIMNHGQQAQAQKSISAPVAPAALPSAPGVMVSQPTGFNPNGPRGPLAPVASNAPLLNRMSCVCLSR